MKKRIIAWAVLLSVCAAALGLWCSAAAGKTARTLPCEDEGLILSITTFDGKSESKPFLKCFGHTWIGLDNRTGHTVYLKDRAIPDGEMVTFSVWAVSGLSGLLFDLEPCYIANYGRYTGRLSLSTNIGEEQLKVIVCAAAGLYGLYNAISCFVTLYKAGHQPYLMAGAVRFDFQGYYMMAAMHAGICLLLGVLMWLFLKGTKKLREKTAVR